MFKADFLKTTILCVIIVAGLLFVGCKKHEHPAEHPNETAQKEQIAKDELADAVESYVKEQASEHGGYFIAFDDKAGKELKLTLDKVHRKRLSRVAEDTYFACADFKTPEGKMYDLDVFMTGPDKDHLAFSKFMVHKEAGKERYTWYEQGGVWKTKTVEAPIEEHPNEPEHPEELEHPKELEHPNEPEKPKKSEHPSEHPM